MMIARNTSLTRIIFSKGLGLAVISLVAAPRGVVGAFVFSQTEQPSPAEIARSAQNAMRDGNYAAAIAGFQKLIKIAPGIAVSHANLGMAYYSASQFHDAATEFRQALKLKPSLVNAHYFLGLTLSKGGECREAIPYLSADYARVPDPALKRELGIDAVRCSMASSRPDGAVDALRKIERDFPSDPEVLYLSSRVYSELSTRASQRLLFTAPDSVQAHQMNAESLEFQGKPEEAAKEYRKILESNPGLAGVHYHLGRLLLSASQDARAQGDAKREFEAELKISPADALSEYELGEMARKARQWDEAVEHFSKAAQLDPSLTDALVGLGKSLLSAGRARDASAPLSKAVELAPDDSVAHYQLSLAYRRLGQAADADKEEAVYQKLRQKQLATMDAVATGMSGRVSKAQTAEPPE